MILLLYLFIDIQQFFHDLLLVMTNQGNFLCLFANSHIFHSSYIENSPNSVGEAQMVGVPVVASRVGGTDSMVEHGKTGFMYPHTSTAHTDIVSYL